MLIPHGSYPRYVPTGHLVYALDGALRGAGFDLERLEVTTSPVPLLEGVITKESGAADFSSPTLERWCTFQVVQLTHNAPSSGSIVAGAKSCFRGSPQATTNPSGCHLTAHAWRSIRASARHLDLRYRSRNHDQDHNGRRRRLVPDLDA
jgi:hypothetical protein